MSTTSPTRPTVYADQDRRAGEWFDLRPSSAPACPRVVAGKRCLLGNDPRRPCICERYDYPLWDHPRMWLDRAGRHVLTLEPYNTYGADIAALLRDLADLGLCVDLSGSSPWNPGERGTFLVLIRRDETAPATRRPTP